jgi:hypothetical protein
VRHKRTPRAWGSPRGDHGWPCGSWSSFQEESLDERIRTKTWFMSRERKTKTKLTKLEDIKKAGGEAKICSRSYRPCCGEQYWWTRMEEKRKPYLWIDIQGRINQRIKVRESWKQARTGSAASGWIRRCRLRRWGAWGTHRADATRSHKGERWLINNKIPFSFHNPGNINYFVGKIKHAKQHFVEEKEEEDEEE